MIINDLCYLARQAAGAIAEGIALGWRVCNAQDTGTTITRSSPRGHNDFGPIQTSPPDDVVSADSVGGERPASDSAILPAADAGHPTSDLDRTLYAGAVGLRMWIRGEPCTAPTYFGSIAADLDTLSK